MKTIEQHRAEICEMGRRLYARNLCSGIDGNLSVRLDGDNLLCTPTGVCKGFLNPADLCVVTLDGVQREGDLARTSEILLHTRIYSLRPDVRAVIHFHPPVASAFAVNGTPLPAGILAEAEVLLGHVPVTPYATPGTAEFAETVSGHLDGTSAILLANHGAVTFASDLFAAWAVAESLENFATIAFHALSLGQPRQLGDADRVVLAAIRNNHRIGTVPS